MGKALAGAVGLGLLAGAYIGTERLNDTQEWAQVPVVDFPDFAYDGMPLANRVDDAVSDIESEISEANALVEEVARGCGVEALSATTNLVIRDANGELVPATIEERADSAAQLTALCVEERAEDLLAIDGVTFDAEGFSTEVFTNQIEDLTSN
jgi:hypothetical protein